jgi:hypothetical protein
LFNVGDVNGDGNTDFVAGAGQTSLDYQRYAFLYYGGTAFDTLPDAKFKGDSSVLTHYASQGGELGDINGDGFNDFAILDFAYAISGPPPILGAIYLYYGGDPPDSVPGVVIHADSVFNRIGFHIAPLGDVNQDGYADWVMSDPACQGPNGESDAGVVAIYYGGNPPDTIPHQVIYGSVPGANLGMGLTTFDWNGDGQKDIFAWCGNFYPPNNHGAVWEFNVTPTMAGQPDHIFFGIPGYPGIGQRLWHVDLDGDGQQDMISGAPGYAMSGLVYVFLNVAGQDTLYDAYYYQDNFEGDLGGAGCNASDINGDEIEDLAILEFYGNGRLHLILGSDSLHQSPVSPVNLPALPLTSLFLKASPNPFNSSTVLSFELPHPGRVTLEVFDIMGREVGALLAAPLAGGAQSRAGKALPLQGTWMPAGMHSVTFDGSGLPSGLYFVRMQAGEVTSVQKVMLLK